VISGPPLTVFQVNTIRIYNLDPDASHDECVSIFNAAGIYMILDVNSPLPNQSLNRGSPWESYTSTYLNRTFAVVEAFKNFPNTLGFFSGNEVINQQSVDQVPSYIRAVTRDIKDYIAKNADRTIPVGYSAADVRELLGDTWSYLGCNIANSTSSKIDFFGLNSYSWCGNSSFTTSSYDQLVAQFSSTTIPVFFSEYGCNLPSPRIFTEVPVIYGPQMTGVMSGGIVYEWDQAVNDYGLVNVNDNGTADLLQDYLNLQGQYDTLNIKALMSSNSTATMLQPPTCQQSLITTSGFDDGFDIPARPAGVEAMINNGISNKPQGKLVALSSTTVSQAVYNVSGQQITGLKLNVLAEDESNTPGSNGSGTSSGTATSSAPSATSSGAAVKNGNADAGKLVWAAVALSFLVDL
jgi:1,3-beta-glucanosyltransferase GAS3